MFFLSLFILLVVFSCWGYTSFLEFKVGKTSFLVKSAYRFGFLWFIISEVIFFFAFFWRFFAFSIVPSTEVGNQWPPVGIEPINPWGIPLLNTIILLSSGVRITWAHSLVKISNRLYSMKKLPSIPLIITIFLGFYFLIIQLVEYSEAPFSIADGVYGTSFFILTGFHGFHVIVGVLFISASLIRLRRLNSYRHVGFECAIWYWHFVDVVWLFLFSFVYVWGRGIIF